jgi:hypothetical protein
MYGPEKEPRAPRADGFAYEPDCVEVEVVAYTAAAKPSSRAVSTMIVRRRWYWMSVGEEGDLWEGSE